MMAGCLKFSPKVHGCVTGFVFDDHCILLLMNLTPRRLLREIDNWKFFVFFCTSCFIVAKVRSVEADFSGVHIDSTCRY